MSANENLQDRLRNALNGSRQSMKRSDLARSTGISKTKVRIEIEQLVAAGVVIREERTEHGSQVFYYHLRGGMWQVKRGRYTSVLCPCGRRVILARVRLRGFEDWYSMICKGCRTMRYINERELEE